MLIHYWCPYLTNIATISSVKRSATYLKKFDKNNKINIEIINSYGEWSNTSLLKDKIIFDLRNIYIPKDLKDMGYEYYGTGK